MNIGSLPVFLGINKGVFVIFFVSIFSQGCSTVKPYTHISKETDGEIFIFRKPAFNVGGTQVVIQVDGENVAKLHGEQYTSIEVGEGIHKLSAKGDGLVQVDTKDVMIKQNQVLYFEAEPNPVRSWIYSACVASGVLGAIAENPLVFGIILAPIIDVTFIKAFSLKESSEQEFKAAAEKFREIEVE